MGLDMEKLQEWFRLDQQLADIKAKELVLRKELFGAAFPKPIEGSKENKVQLPEGWILQGDYKINRTVDQAAVATLATGDNTRPLVDKCFDWQAKLKTGEFKKLDASDLALIAEAVTEKPGTPALKIILPKR